MANISASSKITSKNQTTLPGPIRKALGLEVGDKIRFEVLEGGRVELSKETSVAADDKVVAAYLSFLEQDLVTNPAKLAPLVRTAANRKLLAGVDVSDWLDDQSVQ